MIDQKDSDQFDLLADALIKDLMEMSDEELRSDTVAVYGVERPFYAVAKQLLDKVNLEPRVTAISEKTDRIVELWRGLLSELRWLAASPQPALSETAHSTFFAVEIGTDVVLRQSAAPIKWAVGPLQILAAPSKDGTSYAMRFSVDVNDDADPSGTLLVELRAPDGLVERACLSADRPATVLEGLELRAPFESLELSVASAAS
ncbi:MAG: hypothetical protein WDN76_04755 [Alphaproteobacteria bacterium]